MSLKHKNKNWFYVHFKFCKYFNFLESIFVALAIVETWFWFFRLFGIWLQNWEFRQEPDKNDRPEYDVILSWERRLAVNIF